MSLQPLPPCTTQPAWATQPPPTRMAPATLEVFTPSTACPRARWSSCRRLPSSPPSLLTGNRSRTTWRTSRAAAAALGYERDPLRPFTESTATIGVELTTISPAPVSKAARQRAPWNPVRKRDTAQCAVITPQAITMESGRAKAARPFSREAFKDTMTTCALPPTSARSTKTGGRAARLADYVNAMKWA